MESEQLPKSVTEFVRDEFNSPEFTKTSGNSHYLSRDAEDLALRKESVGAF